MGLGLWAPYIASEPDMFSWYELPKDMQAELAAYRPSMNDMVSLEPLRFARLRTQMVEYVHESLRAFRPAYHNARHAANVERYGVEAIAKLETLKGRRFPLAVKQNLAMALYMHDCHHCGCTYRADAQPLEDLYLPELGAAVTAEWASAYAANQLGKRLGLELPARLFQVMVIWSSTFGGETDRGKALGVPIVEPRGLWGRLMRAADIVPESNLEAWLTNVAKLFSGEKLPFPVPTSVESFLRTEIGFLNHVSRTFALLDEAAGVPLTQELGWSSIVESHLQAVSGVLERSDDPTRIMIRNLLAPYGIGE